MAPSSPKKPKTKLHYIQAFENFSSEMTDLEASYHALSHEILKLNQTLSVKTQELEERLENANKLQQFLDSILNSMSEAVIVIDAEASIVLFNHSAEILTGFVKEEVLGCLYQDLFAMHLSERFSPVYTLKYRESLLHQEKEIISKSNQKIPVRFSTSPIYDPLGQMLGVVEVINDLTRLRQLESVMQQMKTQASMAQMAGLISHEIRNPLGGILGNVDMLMRSSMKIDEFRPALQAIKISVDQINSVVTRFQEFAKSVTPNFQTVDLLKYLKEVLDIFKRKSALNIERIKFNIIGPDEKRSLTWSIDPILIEQVIQDILDNAVKALPGEGLITLQLKHNFPEQKNENVEICITDNGQGMDDDVVQKLFTPFFTTRARGTGLSLAVARNFIHLHRGEIKVKSQKGHGSTFVLYLPK